LAVNDFFFGGGVGGVAMITDEAGKRFIQWY